MQAGGISQKVGDALGDELLQADPHKDDVVSLQYHKDVMFKLTKLPLKPSA